MGKWLNGSAGTGDKIMNNFEDFKYELNKKEGSKDFFSFNWQFNEQIGYVSIRYKDNKISNGSIIGTEESSKHKFDRPLGLYNDDTLFKVFKEMMNSIERKVDGIYSEG